MSQPDVIRLDLPATYKYLNIIGPSVKAILARLENVVEPDIVSHRIELAIHEICTNIVEHAYGGQENGRIEITLSIFQEPAHLTIDLRDNGCPFEPATVSEPDLEHGQVRGYGLFLVHKLMNEVSYHRDNQQNYWHLVTYF